MNRKERTTDVNRKQEILSVSPSVVQRESGWFAVSPPGACLRIGVEASTEAEVIAKFQEALARWAALAELPDRQPVTRDEAYVS